MRIWIGGPRIFGARTGISFSPADFRARPSLRPSVSPSSVQNAPGMVYVITGASLVKIGISDDPLGRLAALQTASPFRLELAYTAAIAGGDARALEQAVHTVLAEYRENGEWFRIAPVMAVGAIASTAFQSGQLIVEIKKENLRYAAERSRAEPIQPKRASWLSIVIFWLFMIFVMAPIMAFILFVAYIIGQSR